MKSLRDNKAKEFETFADVLERAVITLKETGRESDLDGGTPFVVHRVGEIHEQSKPEQRRYVSGHEKPADLCTRGITARALAVSERWWNGPEFLRRLEAE